MAENTGAANTRVVVIGGGYAGTMAANRLTRREGAAVTLINPRPQFVERIRLHQLVGGTHDAVHDFRDVLAKGVRLVLDSASRIDAAERAVLLESGETVEYDYLVYAVGSAGARPTVPGAVDFAHPLSTLEDARRARAAVDAAPAAAAVTVVGAGPTGIETAAELAERGRTVTLVTGGVLAPYFHPGARRALCARLSRLGVEVLDGAGSRAAEVSRAVVRLEDGREVRSDVTLWTAGFAVPDLAVRSGLRTDAAGRLLTDETLTSADSPRIVAAGDSAAPSGVAYRMSCQAALPLGSHAADTVLARIAGATPREVAVGFVAQCVSTGRRTGLLQLASSDDHAKKSFVGGRSGAALKEAICWSTYQALLLEAKHPGSVNWAFIRDGHRAGLLEASHRRYVARTA
ncbi:FAD-dependent oxidoreductase [Sinomonas sp. ASV486]|uniref:NAD(P)/FAD-dependent oxidoreductase n=1 Tax=Sinomonas sp. ASV486 TaxID=3051170 RepID=UPI0027DB2CD4|nr:FAD-dependent oxidoreductase [Sinomonas sp. ASV486]MDQ4492193.1 FAD-dependent oxidoreductase [Sinomonas sp. ASV486]